MPIRRYARFAAIFWTLLGFSGAPLLAEPAARLSTLEAEPLAAAAASLAVGATLEVAAAELAEGEPPVELELTRFEVFAADTLIHVFGDDGETVLGPPANVYLRGRIAGDAGSLVVLALHEDGTSRGIASWTAGGESRISILEGARGPLRGVEVDRGSLSGDPRTFSCEAELPEGIGAGEESAPSEALAAPEAEALALWPSLAPMEGAPLMAATHTARIAIESDFEFYSRFNSVPAATNYIFDLFAYISSIYEAEVGVNLVIGYISLYSTINDPWIETTTHCGFREFGKFWNLNRTGVSRTIAHFMSGRMTGGGVAFLGVLCSPALNVTATGCIGVTGNGSYGGDYGFTGNLAGNFVPGNPGVVWDSKAISHEIGHNFNSPHSHCYAGIGGNSQPVDKCWNAETGTGCWTGTAGLPGPQGQGSGTIMSYCHQIAGGLTNISMNFGTGHAFGVAPGRVATRMREHVLTRASANAACLPVRQQLRTIKAGAGSGTVTSAPAGINCGASCLALFANAASVTLTAAPAAGSVFNSWSGEGCSGTGTCVVSMTQARTVTATFVPTFALALTKGGSGTGTVTSAPAGISCGSTCSASFAAGTSVTLTATPAVGSHLVGWSGEGCSGTGTCIVSMTQARQVSASFSISVYPLNVTKTGTGAGTVTGTPGNLDCGVSCAVSYSHGTSVTLTAVPTAGSTFTGWSGEGCTGTGSCVVSMTQARNVSAAFTQNAYALSVAKTGTGAGTVTSAPAGIDCGATCSTTYNHGTSVTLTAAPAAGSTFTGWTGEGCTGTGSCVVAMTQARNVSAAFTLNTYALTVAKTGTGAGTVTSAPAGIDCGATCSATYNHGASVTLTAAPAAGSTFSGWTGEGCTGTGACVVSMTQARNVSAAFTLNTYALTVAKTGTGVGTVTSAPPGIDCGATCSATYNHGTSVTLTAAPTADSTFSGWTGEGCSGTGSCVVSMTQARNVSAAFTLNTYALSVAKTGTGAGTVTSAPAGIDCGASCSTTYNHGTSVTLTAAPLAGSTFAGWTGEGCTGTGSCVVSMTQARGVSAAFSQNSYSLTVIKTGNGTGGVSSAPAGIDCGASCSATYGHGTSVILTATPSVDSTFAGWSGEGCSGTGTCTVAMSQTRNVAASFTRNSYSLAVAKTGTGAGGVSSAPAGIDCGSSCSASYSHGTSVTLTATPTRGSTFAGWSGEGCSGTGSCTVAMTQARNVSAAFTLDLFWLVLTKEGNGPGRVISSPDGMDCVASCAANFGFGTSVMLKATPGEGTRFAGWSGAGCSGTGVCVVSMTAARHVTARFELLSYLLEASVVGDGSGTVTSSPAGITCGSACQATFLHGTAVTLTAQAAPGSIFVGWSGETCPGTGPCTLTMTQARTVAAVFHVGLFLDGFESGSTSAWSLTVP